MSLYIHKSHNISVLLYHLVCPAKYRMDQLKQIEQLPIMFELIPADVQISQQAGFLIRDYANLGTADAIVAATTLSLDAKLATRNKKDFKGIRGLKLLF